MPELFNTEEVDLSAIYRDSAAPKDPDPSELLFGQIGEAIKGAPSPVRPGVAGAPGVITPVRPGNPNPVTGRRGAPSVATGPGGAGSQGNVAGGPSQDTMDVLGRLKPLGIKNINSLRGKSDVELRKLSSDVVQYALRQQSLNRFFFASQPDHQLGPIDVSHRARRPKATPRTISERLAALDILTS